MSSDEHGRTDSLQARCMWQLLREPSLGSFVAARVLAGVGIWVSNVVAAVVIYDITGSASMVGAVSVAQFGPQLLLSLYMGARADRGNRQRQTAAGQLISALGASGLAITVALSDFQTLESPWPVLVAALLFGVGQTIGAPAAQALIPSMGRPSELSKLIVLSTAPMTIARSVGPGLGALILVKYGPAAAFGFAAVSHLAMATVVLAIKVRSVSRENVGDRSVRQGLTYLKTDRSTLILLVVVAGLGFGMDPIITLSPSIAAGFGQGSELVAQIASAFGIGSAMYLVLSGVLRRTLGIRRVSSLGLATMSVSFLGMGLAPSATLTVACSFVAGFGMMAGMTTLSTRIQERIPEEYRGRIMAPYG